MFNRVFQTVHSIQISAKLEKLLDTLDKKLAGSIFDQLTTKVVEKTNL